MCYTGEDVLRITEEVERQVNPANRCGVFVDRLLELKQKCLKCQEKKAQEDAVWSINMRNVENMLYERHTRGLFSPKDLPSSLRSSKSPSPPRRSKVEHFNPYHPPARRISVKHKASEEAFQASAYQDAKETMVSPPAVTSEVYRTSVPAHTFTSIVTSASITSNQDTKLESFNRWLQRIDNPVDASSAVTPPPGSSPSTMV
jgi:hypothetical protein